MLHHKIRLPPSPPMTPPVQLKMPTDPARLDRQAAGLQTSVPAIWLQASAGISDANIQSRKYRSTKRVVPSNASIPTELQQFSEYSQPNNSDLFLVTNNTPIFHRLPGHQPCSMPLVSGRESQIPDQCRDIWPAGQADQADQNEDDDADDADQASVAGLSARTAAERKEPKRRHRLTKEQTRILVGEYAKYAHPTQAQRQELSRRIPGMSPRQVQVWFQNRRAKLKQVPPDDRDRITRSRAYPSEQDMREALNPANNAQARLSIMGVSTIVENQLDDMRGRGSDVQGHIQGSMSLETQANWDRVRSSLPPNRSAPRILASSPVTGQQSSVSQYGYTSEKVYQTWLSPQYNQNALSYTGVPAVQPWLERSGSNPYWDNGWGYSFHAPAGQPYKYSMGSDGGVIAPDQNRLFEGTRESAIRSVHEYGHYSVRRVDSVNSRLEYLVNSEFPSPEQSHDHEYYKRQQLR